MAFDVWTIPDHHKSSLATTPLSPDLSANRKFAANLLPRGRTAIFINHHQLEQSGAPVSGGRLGRSSEQGSERYHDVTQIMAENAKPDAICALAYPA